MNEEKIKSYKDLDVWKKGICLSKDIYIILAGYPEKERFGLISQMQRAVVSIPANIAEGWGRAGTKEFIHFLNIANGSLAELHTFLVISKELKYISHETCLIFEERVEELQKMTYSLKRSLQNRGQSL